MFRLSQLVTCEVYFEVGVEEELFAAENSFCRMMVKLVDIPVHLVVASALLLLLEAEDSLMHPLYDDVLDIMIEVPV